MNFIIYLLKKIKQNAMIYKEVYFNRKTIDITSEKKQVYILLGADYCNLGDIAIMYAQKKFLRENLDNNYEIITIGNNDTLKVFLNLKKVINSNSIITFIGGGNHGDIYEFIDCNRRFILKKINECKIISFPQTIVYSNTFEGEKKLKEFVKYAKKNVNFYLYAREKNTFDKYRKLNIDNVFLVPDIVFSLDNIFKGTKRSGIGLVLRNDKEKSLSLDFQNIIIDKLQEVEKNVEFMDTCGYNIELDQYDSFLEDYLKKIATKKLIITDRLHGMIFCYITNTPCIVFNNNNGKIISTYNTWLRNQNFIILSSENDNKLFEKINLLLNVKKIKKEDIKNEYTKLIDIVKKAEFKLNDRKYK